VSTEEARHFTIVYGKHQLTFAIRCLLARSTDLFTRALCQSREHWCVSQMICGGPFRYSIIAISRGFNQRHFSISAALNPSPHWPRRASGRFLNGQVFVSSPWNCLNTSRIAGMKPACTLVCSRRRRFGVEYDWMCFALRSEANRPFPTAPGRRTGLPIRSVRNLATESRAISRPGLNLDCSIEATDHVPPADSTKPAKNTPRRALSEVDLDA
jgi:hypothetical protein